MTVKLESHCGLMLLWKRQLTTILSLEFVL